MRDPATERQVLAATPTASTWLSANAGSGKTRVLTDRVARLLLSEVQPQHILCLTYTKAAASEMQNRLFRTLGSWAMKPEADLRRTLHDLGYGDEPDAAALAAARRLFARAIETPGGLRIQTIHGFCAALLRRFPLEAGVSPRFTEMDDRAARLLRDEIAEDMSDRSAPALMTDLARAYTGEDFSALLKQVSAHRAGFDPALTEAQVRALFGVPPDETVGRILADTVRGDERGWLTRVLPALRAGRSTDFDLANALDGVDWTAAPGPETLQALEDALLTGSGAAQPFSAKTNALPTRDTRLRLGGDDLSHLHRLMDRVEAARVRRVSLQAARRTATLHRFAAVFLPIYAARKAARGWLDFDDLITRARALLSDGPTAAWVLFRLDGGIDHILVDEAQDTSPDQWQVIERLAAEFTAGRGTRAGGRTLFVVGDKKQSIYSFQGADVAVFEAKHTAFGTVFQNAGQPFQTLDLRHSFRSAPAVLRLVDAALHDRFPAALGPTVQHVAHKDRMPGRVDLWPLIDPVSETPADDWESPVDRISQTHHTARLARLVAAEIRGLIDAGTRIPTDTGPRALHEGDVLILVQRRSALFADLIRECKKQRLAVAGADRLKLGAELAVKDLAALLAFLATPEDNLALATVLRSPLCGWSEGELYDLAQPRQGYLWQALRVQPSPALDLLTDLRDMADFLRPFELLERALTRHDGRRRLLARLGDEAMEGIDALLDQALAYERHEVPSLTGFLIWLETDDIDIKRQVESEGHRIRIMTVHGAKGLEAPVVILPDTADRTRQEREEVLTPPDAVPLWKTPVAESPARIVAERQRRDARQDEEALRLLYVALTRARAWLIVAGAGVAATQSGPAGKRVPKDPITLCWYRQVEAGMLTAGALPLPDGRLRLSNGDWPASLGSGALGSGALGAGTLGSGSLDPASLDPASLGPTSLGPAARAEVPEVPLPGWATRAAPVAPRPVAPVSPSRLGGAKLLPGDIDPDEDDGRGSVLGPGSSGDDALSRGTALHLLLEHMPATDPARWPALAASLIDDPALCADLLAEAAGVLADPALARLFTGDALTEVALTCAWGGVRLYGAIDRLLVSDSYILAIDYKSNRLVPATLAEVPEGLLRQMGAYAHALAEIYPGRAVETAILWTRAPRLMPLPGDIVRQALSRATIP